MSSSAYIPPGGQTTKTCSCPVSAINNQCSANQTNSPVLLDSGLLTLNVPLMSGAAVGTGGFAFTLNYYPDTSTTSSDGTVGIGWNFLQNIVISASLGYNVILQMGDNTQALFKSSDGINYSASGNNTVALLMRTGIGTSADQFTMVSRAGVMSRFAGLFSSITTPGRLLSFSDRYGNTQTWNWVTMGSPAVVRLQSVVDSYGRTTAFAYNGPSQNYTLQQVTDWLGRQTSLQYDTLGHLTAVVGPSITRGANNNANSFPNGTAYCYEYDIHNSRPERANDLIAVYYPNQVAPYLDSTRTVNVNAVYAGATARQEIVYNNEPTDTFQYGKVQQVVECASNSPAIGSGIYAYMYLNTGLPANLINPTDIVVSETVATDRSGNQIVYDFNAAGMMVRKLAYATRGKNSLQAISWTTWISYNTHNQDVLTVTPEGNSIVKTYEDETNTIQFGGIPYARRIGLLKSVTHLPGNGISIPSRPGSNGQTQLTELYYYDPIFNQQCAMIEVRGNPIDASGDYFVPQNGGNGPTNADRSRYATITLFDYQKDAQATVQADTALQALLFPGVASGTANTQIGALYTWVNNQMAATGGTGGIPAGFLKGLGDVNGEGTGQGTGTNATHIGNVVKVQKPSALQLIPNLYPQTVLSDGPTAYWRLGEASGTTAIDATGNGHAGTYAGGVTLGEPGAIVRDPNTGVGFDGSSGSMTLNDAWAPAGASARTFECWFKTTASFATGQYQVIFTYGTSALNEAAYVFMGTDPNLGTNGFGISQYGNSAGTAGAPAVNDGTWHHGVATFDGTAWHIYLDGVLASTSVLTTNTIPGGTFEMGRSGSSSYWNGELDEVAVYPTALSATQILAHYNAGRAINGWSWATQPRVELFTSNLLGQNTTRTDGEGNVTVTVRYPQNDPEGAAQYLVPTLSNKQYGYVKEIHVDADPATVMTLLGPDADLLAFTGNIIARTNSAGVYLDLVTSYKPSGAGGSCASCAYDPLGNPLAMTDPRNNTTTYDRNELGEAYRTTSPAPYSYQTETSFDSNRNVIQVDTQDVVVQYTTNDPGDPNYAKFVPTGTGSTANLPTMPGSGGSVRPGWFSNLYSYDLLDNKIEQDIDCTGSAVSLIESAAVGLMTAMAYDFNQNLVKIIKPLGNTIEYDYDERNLKIAVRVGGPAGSVTIMAYDGNKSLTDVIGPATRGAAAQTLTAIIGDAFGGSTSVTFSGDWLVQNNYDGFDRKVDSVDAVGGMVLNTFDPGGRTIATQTLGTKGGPTPTDRSGLSNALLASSEARFDEAGRQYEAQRDVFLDSGAYYHGIPSELPSGRTVTHTGGGLATNSTTNSHTATVVLTGPAMSAPLQSAAWSSGGTHTWTAPISGTITVECWGAGGSGASNAYMGGFAGGGGGGGEYAKATNVSVTNSANYTVTVGAGSNTGGGSAGGASSFGSTVIAYGGGGAGSDGSGGVGGTGGVGSTLINGSAGGSNGGGGGGGGAGGNCGGPGGGAGGSGGDIGRNPGGGGGGDDILGDGYGGGADGQVTLTWGGGPTNTSYVLSRTVFDRADRAVATAADNGAVTTITLDGAGRQPLIVDALGNSLEQTFDANGNVIFTTRIETCTISGSIAPERFSTAFAIDVLNRTIITMQQGPDGSLNTNWVVCCSWPVLPPTLFTFTGFDSRNNVTNLIDPKQNTTVWEFDGASRKLREKRHLRPSGDGTTAISDTVLTHWAFDANSNNIRLVDDNGGTTSWIFDLLDRNTVMQFHDGSTRTNLFNPADNVIGYTDENGSYFANTWDVLSRKTAVAITRAAGVVGTTAQAFQYDGISRLTFCRDTANGVNADVGVTYDSINRKLEEQQTYSGDTRYVTNTAFTSFPASGFTFPNSRKIGKTFDALYRKNGVNEGITGITTSIAAWQFFGGRIATVTLGNDIITSFMNNAQTRSAIQLGQTTPPWGSISTDQLGYDGSGRLIGKRHFNGGTVIVGFTTTYDPSSNKLFERALHAESRSSLYALDSMDRLLNYQRGVLATGGASITTPITLPKTDSTRAYALDGLGNWQNTPFTPVSSTPGIDVRTHNKLNQITAFNAPSAPTPVLYDHGNNTGSNAARGSGNIINDGTRINTFDALNRLITVNKVGGGSLGAYVYDAIGRRIIRNVLGAVSGTIPTSTSRYLLDGQQIVEELSSMVGSTSIQYVWGQYIDELIQLKALTTVGPQPLAADAYYLLSDLLYRSAGLTKTTGGAGIVETYDTDAYGDTILFSAGGGTGGAWFSDADVQAAYSACRYVFTGREYDPDTRIYFFRTRNYVPALGRFISRDLVIKTLDIYQYVLGRPVLFLDPSGLEAQWQDEGIVWDPKPILTQSRTAQGPIQANLALVKGNCYLEIGRQILTSVRDLLKGTHSWKRDNQQRQALLDQAAALRKNAQDQLTDAANLIQSAMKQDAIAAHDSKLASAANQAAIDAGALVVLYGLLLPFPGLDIIGAVGALASSGSVVLLYSEAAVAGDEASAAQGAANAFRNQAIGDQNTAAGLQNQAGLLENQAARVSQWEYKTMNLQAWTAWSPWIVTGWASISRIRVPRALCCD